MLSTDFGLRETGRYIMPQLLEILPPVRDLSHAAFDQLYQLTESTISGRGEYHELLRRVFARWTCESFRRVV